jgi:hypothetical protein
MTISTPGVAYAHRVEAKRYVYYMRFTSKSLSAPFSPRDFTWCEKAKRLGTFLARCQPGTDSARCHAGGLPPLLVGGAVVTCALLVDFRLNNKKTTT